MKAPFKTTFFGGVLTGIVICSALLMIPVGISSRGDILAGRSILSVQREDGELLWFLHESNSDPTPVVPIGLRGPFSNRRFLTDHVPMDIIVEGAIDKNTVAVSRLDETTLPVFVCRSRQIGIFTVSLRLFHFVIYPPNDYLGSRYLFVSSIR